MSGRQARVLAQPINVIFRYLQSEATISVWLYDNLDIRIEGTIGGFDEFMNLVIKDAVEVTLPKEATSTKAGRDESRRTLGRILLKGENITLMQEVGKK